jgi:hypothetical protein
MPTTVRVQGCTIGRKESDLRAVVCSRRAEDVQRCYQAVAEECIVHGIRRVLVIGRSSADDALVHLAGRDALRALAVAGLPAGFRLALVAQTRELVEIYHAAVVEAARCGIVARCFKREADAARWLASGPRPQANRVASPV